MISSAMNEDELLAAREHWAAKRAEAEIEVKALEEGLGRAVLAGDGAEARAELRAAQSDVTDANFVLAEIDRLLRQVKFQAQRDSRPGPVLLHFPSPKPTGEEPKGDPIVMFIANSVAGRAKKPNPLR